MQRILVSACLLGEPVRYDGQSKGLQHTLIQQWQKEGRLVAICPEVIGGLTTPRAPAEIIGGDGHQVLNQQASVQTQAKQNVTEAFLAGAQAALNLAKERQCQFALLTAKSPSCGNQTIYSGNFDNQLVTGMGVTAALLSKQGIQVFSQFELLELRRELESDVKRKT